MTGVDPDKMVPLGWPRAPEAPEMQFLRSFGLLLSYKCPASCAHCSLQAGLHRTEQMRPGDALGWIQQIAEYRNRHIRVLTLAGGESFCDLPTLKLISDYAHDCGLFVSADTNAFWASSVARAAEILSRLTSIRLLSISSDTCHQESIPFERVANAVTAARECGVSCCISVCTESEEDPEYRQIMRKLAELVPEEAISTTIGFPVGRTPDHVRHPRYATSSEPPISTCSAGTSPVILPDGLVFACLGPIIDVKSDHPLCLGNLGEQSLEEILDHAELNVVLHAIRLWGPRKLIDLANKAGLGKYLPSQFIKGSVCYACFCLMKSPEIVSFLRELARDLEFARRVAYGRVYYLNEPYAAVHLQPELFDVLGDPNPLSPQGNTHSEIQAERAS